jgi:hypothetical protein
MNWSQYRNRAYCCYLVESPDTAKPFSMLFRILLGLTLTILLTYSGLLV